MKGKLKRTLQERCPHCGSVLQVRCRTEEALLKGRKLKKGIDYVSCSNESCDYERKMTQKRRKLRERDFVDS